MPNIPACNLPAPAHYLYSITYTYIMSKYFAVLLLASCFLLPASAAIVDTVRISYPDPAGNKTYPCVVIRPDAYDSADSLQRYPAVYLLHGYSGNAYNWISKVPALKDYADQYQVLIVCPDGGFSSWYFDSPVDSTMRYETYIGHTVPSYIDSAYRTIADRSGRAITGLSMGGHGGLFLGFRHSSFFGACGSMSGGVNLLPFQSKYDIAKRLGSPAKYPAHWKKYAVLEMIEQKPADSLAIIIDCGTEDFFYADNKALHEKLLQLKITHDYIERGGGHNWAYWENAVSYQLLFFHRYFVQQARTS